MQYIDFKTLLYSDTPVPDIFINEYLPALKSEYVKIYIYCLFLVGKNRGPSVQELARLLDIPLETVKKGLHFMSNLNILSWTEEGIVVKDLKEIEINKFYRAKSTSTPEEAAGSGKLNIRRRQAIEAINHKFFCGVMSPSWYGDIDLWFEQYGFEEDVMLMLFQHCWDNGAFAKSYIAKVAENMCLKGVRNAFDFDRYIREYEEMKAVSAKIQKKLKLPRRLNDYQQEYVDKWINAFGFTFDIIEIALRKTTDRPEAAFSYFDKILTDWHKRGLGTVEQVLADQKRFKAENPDNLRQSAGGKTEGAAAWNGGAARGDAARSVRNRGNFKQRDYDDATLEQFVTNEFGTADEPAIADGEESDKSGGDITESELLQADRGDS